MADPTTSQPATGPARTVLRRCAIAQDLSYEVELDDQGDRDVGLVMAGDVYEATSHEVLAELHRAGLITDDCDSAELFGDRIFIAAAGRQALGPYRVGRNG